MLLALFTFCTFSVVAEPILQQMKAFVLPMRFIAQ
jgi:hypothetical protein